MGNYGRQSLYPAIAPVYREIKVVVISWQTAEAVGSKVYQIHGLPNAECRVSSADCKITCSLPQAVLTLKDFLVKLKSE